MTLFVRSEYFKTALDTAVGEKKKLIEVTECPHHVLVTIIDFIYGTEIPDDLSLDALKSLLGMADLFLMEDLKKAASSSIGKRLSAENIMEMVKLGEKYTADKLKELCTDFLISNQAHGNVARKVLGFNLEQTFKKRRHFKSDEEYRVYFMTIVRPNMIVKILDADNGEKFGRVVSSNVDSVNVKWQNGILHAFYRKDLQIVTPPIDMKMFSN